MMDNLQFTVASCKIAELAHVMGVRNIKALPGAWHCRIDDKWEIATNGHDTTIDVEPPGACTGVHPLALAPDETSGVNAKGKSTSAMLVSIDPYHTAVWYNGWPAGLINPFGGIIAAGEGANEDTFIAALDRAIAEARGKARRDDDDL